MSAQLPPRPVRCTIYAATVASWIVLIVCAFAPYADRIVTDDDKRLAMLVAALGTVKWLLRRMLQPAHEVFMAGKMAGRADALAEHDDSVVRLDDHRRRSTLSVVTKI